jgi:triacylglycerol esterase/lipase EstA (alpha/beta hydrolase family)
MNRITPLLRLVAILVACTATGQVFAAEKISYETFEANGVKIRYFVEGDGEPVVLIHGLYSSADLNWKIPGTVTMLAKNHKVIALDLPGHGGSDKPEKEEAYGAQMSEDVILLLDHLKIKKAHIVGYSLGGMITLKLIADHPDRVLSGTLCGMGWMKEGSPLQKFWEKIPTREGGGAGAMCMNCMGKLAITEDALKEIKTPMKVLIGDRDPVKKLYVEPLMSVRKDWPVIEIDGAGHLICIFKKDFKDELVKWVDKNTQK